MVICFKCNKESPEDASYCSRCGTALASEKNSKIVYPYNKTPEFFMLMSKMRDIINSTGLHTHGEFLCDPLWVYPNHVNNSILTGASIMACIRGDRVGISNVSVRVFYPNGAEIVVQYNYQEHAFEDAEKVARALSVLEYTVRIEQYGFSNDRIYYDFQQGSFREAEFVSISPLYG